MTNPAPEHAVIVLAHGSRDPQWQLPVQAVAQRIHTRAPLAAVRCAYLELCDPPFALTVDALVAAGARHITVLPLFFGLGRHAREELPELLHAARQRHPSITLHALPTAGEQAAVLDLLADTTVRVLDTGL